MVAVALAAACGNDHERVEPELEDSPMDLTCEAKPDPHCANPIDRVLIPKLRALGIEPRDATPDELCRRLAIDLLGRAPTAQERILCKEKTVSEVARGFLESDEFVRTQRRAWGDLFGYEALVVWGDDLADLDDKVGQLYRGEVDYAEFVHEAVVHPAFYGLHPGDGWIANVFQTFLGRPARKDEIDSARPLTQAWAPRAFAGGEVFWNTYAILKGFQVPESDATAYGNVVTYIRTRIENGSNLCRCTPGLRNVGCVSDVFGELVRFAPMCTAMDANDPANSYRRAARSPSADDLCPDRMTHRPECADRIAGKTENSFTAYSPMEQMTPAMNAEWRKIGGALVKRPELWEAAADRELKKLLGWWQTTLRQPDSDLPEVRALLAQLMREGATVPEIVELIVTSQLYVQPRRLPDGQDGAKLPPWTAGPSRLLSGESWWASATAAVGETAGTCDFRWVHTSVYDPLRTDPRFVESRRGSIDARYPGPVPQWGHSIKAIQRLGGCTGDATRPEISSLGLAFAQAEIARELCSIATTVTPPDWSGDLDTAAIHLIDRVWSRAPIAGEVEAMVTEMQECIAAGSSGCADEEVAARWMCVRLLDSAEFSTY